MDAVTAVISSHLVNLTLVITWFDVHVAMSTVTHHCLTPNDELI
jgi:hypothetical protein